MGMLYLFTENGVKTGFTPTLFSKTFDLVTYTPAAINHSTVNISDNFAKSPINIRFSNDNIYAKRVWETVIDFPIKINIYKDENPFWEGHVVDATLEGPYIDLKCDSGYAQGPRGGNIPVLPLHCRHKLYTTECGVIQSSWAFPYTIQAINGTTLTYTSISEAVGYFNNGIITLDNQTRRILDQTDTQVIVNYVFNNPGNMNSILYPGCALTEAACLAFANLDNYGGASRLPVKKNPFQAEGLL